MIKKSTKIIALGSVLGMSLLAVGLYKNIIPLPIVSSVHQSYITDFSDDKKLMGATHNVFVGKVIKKSGTKNLGIGPETQFSVEVVSNIKGNLSGIVTVNQLGGYQKGILYLLEGGDSNASESSKESSSDKLLDVGKTYLFASRYNADENWHTLVSHPNARKLISSDKNLSLDQLKSLGDKDSRIAELKEAYKNEILLESDVQGNYTLNSYTSVYPDKKTNTVK